LSEKDFTSYSVKGVFQRVGLDDWLEGGFDIISLEVLILISSPATASSDYKDYPGLALYECCYVYD
jgi:hypothetical protein